MAGKFILIKEKSASDVSSLDLTNCFKAEYNLYEVITTVKIPSGSSVSNVRQRFLDSSGSAITASEYNAGTWRVDQYNAVEYATNRDYLNTGVFNGADSLVNIRHSIANPYASDRYTTGYSSRYMDLASPRDRAFYGLEGLKNVQRVTGIQTYGTGGNIDVNIVCYGYEES